MNKESLSVRELLNESLDPLNIDTAEIRTLSDSLPKDGNIDLNNAEILATKYVRGADICAELLAIATAYAQKTDALKKQAYSKAALENSDTYFTNKNNGKKPDKITDKMRILYADMDESYISASNKHDEALAFLKWVDSKYSSFVRMHYLCKKILDRGYSHERASSWVGSLEEDQNGDLRTTREAEKQENNKNKEEDYDLGW